MAIAFDAVATTGNSSGSSLTWTHVVGAGTNTILIVGVSRNHNSVSGVTYNSVALTKARADGVDGKLADIWYLLAPATGSNSVVVTLSSSASFAYGGSISFTGVSQSSPIDAQAGSGIVSAGSTATISATITTVATNAMIVDCVMTNDAAAGGALTITGGQTSRWNNGIDGGGHGVGASTLAATSPTSYIPSWSDTDTGPSWGYSVISLTPAAAPASTFIPRRALMGVGI